LNGLVCLIVLVLISGLISMGIRIGWLFDSLVFECILIWFTILEV